MWHVHLVTGIYTYYNAILSNNQENKFDGIYVARVINPAETYLTLFGINRGR